MFAQQFWTVWTAKGQTRGMLSVGGGSCHGRPGRYRYARISRLCLDDRTLPASLSLLSIHRLPSVSMSWQPAQHDNRTTKGDETSAVSNLNHKLVSCHHHIKFTKSHFHNKIVHTIILVSQVRISHWAPKIYHTTFKMLFEETDV